MTNVMKWNILKEENKIFVDIDGKPVSITGSEAIELIQRMIVIHNNDIDNLTKARAVIYDGERALCPKCRKHVFSVSSGRNQTYHDYLKGKYKACPKCGCLLCGINQSGGYKR